MGYPGETEADVEELASFLEAAQLSWAGFFPYSAEDGTDAAELPGQIDHDEIEERLRYLQRLQDDITAAQNAEAVGRTFDVLVDQVEDGQPVGRSYREAPEIDGMIVLDSGQAGDWVRATLTGVYGTDTTASVVRP